MSNKYQTTKGNKDLKVITCIQARMGSTRLKKKALRKISGKTLIEQIFNRLQTAKEIDGIVLATSLNKENDALVKHAKKIGLEYYRGSEKDLVSRLYETCKKFKADALVRITGDCPLVDPDLVDKLVNVFRCQPDRYDYLTNIFPRTFPDGLDTEVYPFLTLKKLYQEIGKNSSDRENFPGYILKNHRRFRIFNLKNPQDLSPVRITVDYPEDLVLVRRIFKILGEEDKIFKMQDIIKLLDQMPNLKLINIKRGFSLKKTI